MSAGVNTFCFAHIWTCLYGIYIITDKNYNLVVTTFQWLHVYLYDLVKVDELIDLAN